LAGREGLAGQRAPDLDLRSAGVGGARAATLFGLLPPARFLLLNLGSSAASAAALAGFADRLNAVTAELTGDTGAFSGIRTMLIRPDGYIAWAAAANEAPPLDRWLGHAS
jgi:bifunctional hydroxylase/dehydrase